MEKKLQTELPSIMEIQKSYLALPVVSSPILYFKDPNAQSSSQHPPPLHTDPHRRKKDPLGSIFVACFTSAVGYTALAPFERVKLLLQTQNEQIRSGRLSYPYRGIKDCLCTTIKHEGLLSMWRGNLTHIALYLQTRAVKMAINSCLLSNASPKRDEHGPKNYSAKSIALAYVIASIPRLLTYPLEFGRTRLACDVKQAHGSWQFTTLVDAYQKMFKSNGIAGLYRGYSIALCGDIVSFTIAALRLKTQSRKQDDREIALYVHAPISMATQVALYPFDTVCRRMMMTTGEEARYAGAVDAFRQIVKREGLSSLYKGMGAYILQVCAAYCSYLILATSYLDLTKKVSSAHPKEN